jgi:Protein of unknown function (DUF1822)
MSFTTDLFPHSLWLEIPDRPRQFPPFSTSGAQWRATINQMCWDTVLLWVQEEYARAVKPASLNVWKNVWEFVNGTKIEGAEINWVMIPSTAIDQTELRVPQEWVDIPAWKADYYFAVRVSPDANELLIWGYTTHYQLKTQGKYDGADRTYSLTEDDLIQDMNVLWVSEQMPDSEILQADTASISPLSIAQAQSLLERLGNPAVIFPRLAVPFSLWAALITHPAWRQQLYERRQGNTPNSVSQWLQAGLSSWAERAGWGVAEVAAFQGVRSRDSALGSLGLLRSLAIDGQPHELRVFPVGLPESNTWRFELRCAQGQVAAGIVLRLLSEDLQPFEHNEDRAGAESNRLYVDVVVETGEGLVWEIEPLPEEYLPEVLYF